MATMMTRAKAPPKPAPRPILAPEVRPPAEGIGVIVAVALGEDDVAAEVNKDVVVGSTVEVVDVSSEVVVGSSLDDVVVGSTLISGLEGEGEGEGSGVELGGGGGGGD